MCCSSLTRHSLCGHAAFKTPLVCSCSAARCTAQDREQHCLFALLSGHGVSAAGQTALSLITNPVSHQSLSLRHCKNAFQPIA